MSKWGKGIYTPGAWLRACLLLSLPPFPLACPLLRRGRGPTPPAPCPPAHTARAASSFCWALCFHCPSHWHRTRPAGPSRLTRPSCISATLTRISRGITDCVTAQRIKAPRHSALPAATVFCAPPSSFSCHCVLCPPSSFSCHCVLPPHPQAPSEAAQTSSY
jgi:hypothetical protein